MDLTVLRYNSAKDHSNSVLLVDKRYECHGLEDEFRTSKVYGETRIPDGKYRIKFRKEGGFHNRYLKKYGGVFHKGMLEIQDVPNFKYVLIHVGNDDDDTAGCYLVGEDVTGGSNWISGSGNAYKKLYPKVRNALLNNQNVTITFKTLDEPVNK